MASVARLAVSRFRVSCISRNFRCTACILSGLPSQSVSAPQSNSGLALDCSNSGTTKSPQRMLGSPTQGCRCRGFIRAYVSQWVWYEMTIGRFDHDHFFSEEAGTGGATVTTMRDVFDYAAPLGPLGTIAERLFLTAYLERFLRERAAALKRLAESDAWRGFVPDTD